MKAAKAGVGSVEKEDYNANVKEIVDAYSELGGGGRGGSALNMSALSKIKW